jgi:hypothetical protein
MSTLTLLSRALLFAMFAIVAFAQNSETATNDNVALDSPERYEYKLLATNKTSTMQKEISQAAEDGYRFQGVMGGETGFGGHEVVIIMGRPFASRDRERYQYKLLATNKTSTMEKELQNAGNSGYEYKGQSVFQSAFGGKEVVVILERDNEKRLAKWQYKLLATNKTSTMEKELAAAARQGYQVVGLTLAPTAFGGKEIVTILRRASSIKAIASN